jgi:two-component system CheB/CheR fusion protein
MRNNDSNAPSRIMVAGIGASAGGIDALRQLFLALPDDLGIAYVVVVHLAPDHDSELAAILGRCTKMSVMEVGDRPRELTPNCVYVIAPDRKLEITADTIAAGKFADLRERRAAIDVFFRSLAAHGDGFAVVLSGGGSDG